MDSSARLKQILQIEDSELFLRLRITAMPEDLPDDPVGIIEIRIRWVPTPNSNNGNYEVTKHIISLSNGKKTEVSKKTISTSSNFFQSLERAEDERRFMTYSGNWTEVYCRQPHWSEIKLKKA